MFRFSNSGNLVALILCLTSLSGNAQTLNCYEKSPNYANLGDDYFNLEDPRTLSDKDREMLDALYSKIEGNWEGEITEIECKGPDRNPRMEYNNYELNADITPSTNGGLTIKATKYETIKKIKKGLTINLLDNTHTFEFKFAADNHLIFSERYRRRNANGSSRLNEYINDIYITDNTLVLKTLVFVNGVYVSEEIWTLTGK